MNEIKITVEGPTHYCSWIGAPDPKRLVEVVQELLRAVLKKEKP